MQEVWAEVHHRTTCGASLNSPTILFDIMVQLEPQGCYFNTPPAPHSSSTFPPVSPLLCCWLWEFGPLVLIWPHTPGVSVCSFCFSLLPDRRPRSQDFCCSQDIADQWVSLFYIWVIRLKTWKYFLHVLYESKWRKSGKLYVLTVACADGSFSFLMISARILLHLVLISIMLLPTAITSSIFKQPGFYCKCKMSDVICVNAIAPQGVTVPSANP